MKYFYLLQLFKSKHIIRTLLIIGFLSFNLSKVVAQCPANIDFELGDFTGWQCFSGNYTGGDPNPSLTAGPVANRHVILSALSNPGLDEYGQFSKICPNGSGYSVRIGNDQRGGTCDKISYTFTIPANQPNFNLIYNYAIVLNDNNAHPANIQPRIVIEVKNVTDGIVDPCTSFPIVVGAGLPGFFDADKRASDGTVVRCRNWAAASINLDNHQGKTIQISFAVSGCGQTQHFGYAYLDVSSQCGSSFTGATFCKDDTLVKVTAPFGYQAYQWYDGTHTNAIGTSQTLTLKPPPLSGDSVIVDMTPFSGYGCVTTLKAYLWDTLKIIASAGRDKSTCQGKAAQIGVPPTPGFIYKWSPTNGLNEPDISNPLASPSVSTLYTLTVTNAGGGCASSASVNVSVDEMSDSLQVIGNANYCIGSGQPTVLKMLPADSLQWYKDNVAIPGATAQILKIIQSGAYYGKQFSDAGCISTTKIQQVNIYETPAASFNVDKPTQCFPLNSFVFTNGSSIVDGSALTYNWDMGDGKFFATPDVTYSYDKPGTYTVKLTAIGPGGCMDDSIFNVIVTPGVMASFTINKPVLCFKNNVFNLTNNSISSGSATYTWDMGDGSPLINANNVNYNYNLPGTYTIKLAANVPVGCNDDSAFTVVVNASPIAGYSINTPDQCFPGHQFVLKNSSKLSSGTMNYTWSMGNDSALITSTDLNYSYAKPGAYTIKLLASTLAGCADSIFKDVEVYATPLADFTIRPVCENLIVPIINRTFNNSNSTVNYVWNFGNGHTDNVKSPVYSYPASGTYPVSLTVSTVQCPLFPDTKILPVTIDAPAPDITYPDKDAAYGFPEPLQARQFGTSVTWAPPTSLSNRFSYTPTFTGITPQLYTVTIKTATGCITVDTQFVQTHKKIEIYVPNAFTPNANGVNDRLRPVLIGFTKVNYFRIYNRWGQLLFTMNSDQPGWDGKINNKPAEIQSVIWMIEAVDVDGIVHKQQGTTVLYR